MFLLASGTHRRLHSVADGVPCASQYIFGTRPSSVSSVDSRRTRIRAAAGAPGPATSWPQLTSTPHAPPLPSIARCASVGGTADAVGLNTLRAFNALRFSGVPPCGVTLTQLPCSIFSAPEIRCSENAAPQPLHKHAPLHSELSWRHRRYGFRKLTATRLAPGQLPVPLRKNAPLQTGRYGLRATAPTFTLRRPTSRCAIHAGSIAGASAAISLRFASSPSAKWLSRAGYRLPAFTLLGSLRDPRRAGLQPTRSRTDAGSLAPRVRRLGSVSAMRLSDRTVSSVAIAAFKRVPISGSLGTLLLRSEYGTHRRHRCSAFYPP